MTHLFQAPGLMPVPICCRAYLNIIFQIDLAKLFYKPPHNSVHIYTNDKKNQAQGRGSGSRVVPLALQQFLLPANFGANFRGSHKGSWASKPSGWGVPPSSHFLDSPEPSLRDTSSPTRWLGGWRRNKMPLKRLEQGIENFRSWIPPAIFLLSKLSDDGRLVVYNLGPQT